METNQGSFQRSGQSTDNLEQGRPVHQRARADNGTQTASNPHWSNPINREMCVSGLMQKKICIFQSYCSITPDTLSQQQRTSHTLSVRSQGQDPNGWNTWFGMTVLLSEIYR